MEIFFLPRKLFWHMVWGRGQSYIFSLVWIPFSEQSFVSPSVCCIPTAMQAWLCVCSSCFPRSVSHILRCPPSQIDQAFEAVRSPLSSPVFGIWLYHVLPWNSPAVFVVCCCGVLYGDCQHWNKEHRDIWGSWDHAVRMRVGAWHAEPKQVLTWEISLPVTPRIPVSTADAVTPPPGWRSPFPCIACPLAVTLALVGLSCLQARQVLPWVSLAGTSVSLVLISSSTWTALYGCLGASGFLF